jgi:predicted ATPase
VAKQLSQLALRSADAAAISLSGRLLAQTCHFMGDHATAKLLAERVLQHPPRRMPPAYISPVPRRVAMRIVLARILWIEGHPDQAAAMAEACVAQAAEHPFALTQALALAACPIALWRGDDLVARALVDRLMAHAARHPSAYWQSWPKGYDAVLRLRAAPATSTLPLAANVMERDCLGTLAEALAGADTIARVEQGTVGWCAPEILRAQGENALARGMPQAGSAAESKFLQSLDLARLQGALSWALRAASSLARLWHGQGRGSEAHRVLAEVHGRFTEGFATADLRAARSLLDELAPYANSR